MNRQMELEQKLNRPDATPDERLAALRELMALYRDGTLEPPTATNDVNNHIHTIYSFSPYSPTGAAYTAWKNGLQTAGIMDHDSVAGAREFIAAGEIIGIAVTCGFEVRCRIDNTPFVGRRTNNPDQTSIAYVTCHGIPHQNLEAAQEWLKPYRAHREQRNRQMVERINALMAASGIVLDYDRDVRVLSQAANGGTVSERHLLYALAMKMTDKWGRGPQVLDQLKERLGIEVGGKNRELLSDPGNSMYEYYLLGVLKGNMVEQFYVDAVEECPDIADFVAFAQKIGAVPAYPYLGDVGDSVTGDKKAQRFEDEYLDELIDWVSGAGFYAITYMPTRNTSEQLARLIALCEKYQFFQISGEDINTPFQSFRCAAIQEPQFDHLVDSTWALIGQEWRASDSLDEGMFSERTIQAMPALADRIAFFAAYARERFGAVDTN